MSEMKIKVPEGMLEAVYEKRSRTFCITDAQNIKVALEAALRWLSENPIGPTMEQAMALRDLAISTSHGYGQVQPTMASEVAVVVEWQRRMFLAPESEYIGEEKLENFCGRFQRIDEAVREAYRRGQQSK